MIPDLLKNDLFSGESRGSSEAVSQSILFLVVITLVAGAGSVGGDVINSAQDDQSLDRGVRGFVEAHETATTFTKTGAENEFSTSGKSTKVKLVDAKLVEKPETEITIQDGGSSYDIVSTPLTIEHDKFRLFYDTGVVSGVESGSSDKTVHWSPIGNERSADGVLPLTTLSTSNEIRESGGVARLYLTQEQPPESATVSSGTSITVNTTTPHGWKAYLDSYNFLTEPTVSELGGRKIIEAEVTSSTDTVLIQHQKVNARSL